MLMPYVLGVRIRCVRILVHLVFYIASHSNIAKSESEVFVDSSFFNILEIFEFVPCGVSVCFIIIIILPQRTTLCSVFMLFQQFGRFFNRKKCSYFQFRF